MTHLINKTKWKMMLDIVDHIQKEGGCIYGGFVRDRIIHDHHADHFYEHVNSRQEYTFEQVQNLYNDKSFLPEHADRCLIPHDIDCFMSDSHLVNFLTCLSKEYTLKVKKSGPAHFYFSGMIPSCNVLMHSKISVSFKINKILRSTIDVGSYTVDLDVMHASDSVNIYKELSSNFDFECNSLILTPQNDYQLAHSLSQFMNPFEKLKKIEAIIGDIKSKKAVVVSTSRTPLGGVPHYRIVKMLAKDFKIESLSIEINMEDYDGYCIVCHSKIDDRQYNIKHRSCDARCHSLCFLRMIEHDTFKNECAMCKCQCFVNVEEKKAISVVSNIEEVLELRNQIGEQIV